MLWIRWKLHGIRAKQRHDEADLLMLNTLPDVELRLIRAALQGVMDDNRLSLYKP